MESIFEKEANWTKMKRIINSWLGTPYRHLACVKGRGADCTLFIGGCWKEYGIIKKVKYDYYPRDWHIHTHKEYVLEGLYDHWYNHLNPGYDLIKYEKDDARELKLCKGDVLTFSTTKMKVTNHASIYLGTLSKNEVMVHSIHPRGVSTFPYGNFWSNKLNYIFRIAEK